MWWGEGELEGFGGVGEVESLLSPSWMGKGPRGLATTPCGIVPAESRASGKAVKAAFFGIVPDR